MYLNSQEDTNNFKIYVPKTSGNYVNLEDSNKENIEFDLEIKIWVNNDK